MHQKEVVQRAIPCLAECTKIVSFLQQHKDKRAIGMFPYLLSSTLNNSNSPYLSRRPYSITCFQYPICPQKLAYFKLPLCGNKEGKAFQETFFSLSLGRGFAPRFGIKATSAIPSFFLGGPRQCAQVSAKQFPSHYTSPIIWMPAAVFMILLSHVVLVMCVQY